MTSQWIDRLRPPLVFAVGGVAIGFFIGRECAPREPAKNTEPNAFAIGAAPAGDPRNDEISPEKQLNVERGTTADWRRKWESLNGQPATPATEEQMRACMVELGARDFAAALKLAQEAVSPRLRELFRNSALQGGATRDPQTATTWALAHVRPQERRAAVEAVAAGAIARPAEAIRAFQRLIVDDPTLASDHGNALTSAFLHAGRFDIASEFADAGPSQFRASWLSNVYHSWAICQPQAALSNLEKISDSATRHEAMSGLFAGWASSDPAALVGYAQTLPVGEMRLDALKEGLTQWVFRDSAEASVWMDKFDPNPTLDAGAAALAVLPALIEKKPDVAASWAESITDSELRANTLVDLIRLWAERDAAGARNYVTTSTTLPSETRTLAMSILNGAP